MLWKNLGWDVDPDGLRVEGGADAEIDLHITSSDVKYRKERATAVTLSVEAERAGRRLATARTSFTIHDRAVYERLRGRNADIENANARVLPLPPPSPTQHAGRDRYEDVVLSCTDVPLRWQLRTDTSHPVLFDHPVDHAPGMLLLEAARQATQSATHPRRTLVVGLSCDFTRYAEFDAPCWVSAKPLAPRPVRTTTHAGHGGTERRGGLHVGRHPVRSPGRPLTPPPPRPAGGPDGRHPFKPVGD
ncbi:ScbA/BarX family gamma-butyrolactone biosynthesis protein [Streptomyces sp. NPDC101112]|uniref:ScbA/BarX family gamma-butyrolactone biosynthesis protein n=1 Tax=Streptomyces sp. NPDC101112 TaxID=3366105 RepID=UPI0037F9134D